MYQNNGLLRVDAYSRFLSITGAAPTTAAGALDTGYDPAFVDFFNKAGAKTYTGSVGDFAHRPQLGMHRVRGLGSGEAVGRDRPGYEWWCLPVPVRS